MDPAWQHRDTRPRRPTDRLEAARPWLRLVGPSEAGQRLEVTIRRAAAAGDTTVLLGGETGCGNDEVARSICLLSDPAAGPFVAINCGAMAATLVESRLFGHERGSFTGAIAGSPGVFRIAAVGAVFLDEIGEMPLEVQPRLLRAIQEREVTPVGGSRPSRFEVRIITATNRILEAEVRQGRRREDMLYRLNTIEFEVPPLRHRIDDLTATGGHEGQAAGTTFHGVQIWTLLWWQPERERLGRPRAEIHRRHQRQGLCDAAGTQRDRRAQVHDRPVRGDPTAWSDHAGDRRLRSGDLLHTGKDRNRR